MNFLTLETRESPVILDWLFDSDPWIQDRSAAIRVAGEQLASQITHPDVSRIRVRVEPITTNTDDRLAEGQPWQWTGQGVVRFDTTRIWDRVYHFASAVQHEIGHVLGVTGHTGKPDDVLFSQAPIQPSRLTSESVNAFRSLGYAVELPIPNYTEENPYTGHLVTVSCPWGEGWMKTPPAIAEFLQQER